MGERVKAAELKRAVLPSLLAGTERQPLPVDAQVLGPLAALSLGGQLLRFTAPDSPTAFAVEPVIEDRRRVVPDALRRPMVRLLAGKTATEHAGIAIARALDERRMRPHPFDLPKLEAFVRAHAERLGPTAQQWAQRSGADTESVTFYNDDPLDDATWTRAPTRRRVLYVAERRRQDAGAARALLQAVWAQESAEARFRLLQAMQTELTAQDIPFLESLDKDRAPRVRGLAQRMLAKLDAGGVNTALKEVIERIKRTQTGLLRKRTALALELPATVKEQAAPAWIREAFAEVSLEDLARALSLREIDMVEAASADENFLLALALMATIECRLDVLDAAVKHLPGAWQQLSDTGLNDLGAMPRDERTRWADILIRAYGRKLPWNYPAWSWLHTILDGAAPTSLLDTAFRSDWFAEEPTVAKHTPYWMEVTAALCPSSQRNELRHRLARFDAGLTVTAIILLDFLDALESNTQHA